MEGRLWRIESVECSMHSKKGAKHLALMETLRALSQSRARDAVRVTHSLGAQKRRTLIWLPTFATPPEETLSLDKRSPSIFHIAYNYDADNVHSKIYVFCDTLYTFIESDF